MPPIAVEPGTRLVDRYRLEDHVGEQGGASFWRALDEVLDRRVGVYLLDADAERAHAILAAAGRATTVTDPRFLRVLDASEAEGLVYVVTEWVDARNLTELLADGPLAPAEARALVTEVAEALAAAHRAGLAHLCLQPEHVLRTEHGQLKLVGLAVDAAVRGVSADGPADAARLDASGCGALLYAALTARWPSDQPSALPAAPYDAGELCSPRQVRAGVPVDLDHIAVRALGVRANTHGRHPASPLTSPDAVAESLLAAHVTTRLPAATAPPGGADDLPAAEAGPYVAPYDDTGGRRRRLVTRGAWSLTMLVLLVGLGLAGWQLLVAVLDDPGQPGAAPSSSASSRSATGNRPLDVAGVVGFDPSPGNGEENDEAAANVTDGDPGTVWTTKSYFDQFGPGGLKSGVGLVLDLGREQSVSRVLVDLQGGPHDLQLRAADTRGENVDDYRLVARASGSTGEAELVPDQPVSARYLLVWLTTLPVDGSDYRGTISDITVRGSA